jgi:glycerol-3-phosphate O-acyltransferase
MKHADMSNRSHQNYKETKSGLRKFIDRILKGSHQHYFQYFPSPSGFLTFIFLKRFFSGIVLENEQTQIIKELPQNAIMVYLTKQKSHFEYLFYHTRYRQINLPVPELTLNYKIRLWQRLSRWVRILLARIDSLITTRSWPNPYKTEYFKEELLQGRTGFLSLVQKRGFRHWFVKSKTDPLLHLVEIQKSIERPIYLIPHLAFFSKKPAPQVPSIVDILFGTEQKPGALKRLVILIRKPGKVFVEISEPSNIKEFIERPEHIDLPLEQVALLLRRRLLNQFNRHRQSITGPTIKSTEELKESILTGERMRRFMEQYAQNRKKPIHKVRKEAAACLDEISARYNYFMITIYRAIVGWVINTMFDGAVVDRKGLSIIKAYSLKGPLILIPCHKSHIDYMILSYVLYTNNMPCPHVAAGKNLSFWPVGPLFRAAGAFFIRRTFRGAVLYAKVFAEYIHKLLKEGFNIEQFIEGGRSRTGKLFPPKLGLLSILINAYRNGACKDMIIVPVFIGYDQVLEESAYLYEIEGGKKKPENLKQVVEARKFLKKRYGKIYINFHGPISMNDLLQQFESPLTEMSVKEQNTLIRNLGWRIINAIDQVTIITPHSIVAAALLNINKKRFSRNELMLSVETYLNYLVYQKAKLADTLIFDSAHATKNALDNYIQRKIVEPFNEDKKETGLEVLYSVVSTKRPILEYYKNNSIAYFIPIAFTAAAILNKDAFQFCAQDLHDQYAFLQDLFKYEFAFNKDKSHEYFVRKSIKAFINEAILIPHQTLPDTYNITSAGFRKLKLFARFLRTYFESYWVTLSYINNSPHNSKEKLKKIQSLGQKMLKRKEIELNESLSKINYANAVASFSSQRIKGSENREAITPFQNAIQNYLDLLLK